MFRKGSCRCLAAGKKLKLAPYYYQYITHGAVQCSTVTLYGTVYTCTVIAVHTQCGTVTHGVYKIFELMTEIVLM